MKLTRHALRENVLLRETASPTPEQGYDLWQKRASALFARWPEANLQLPPSVPCDPVRKRAASSSPRR
jgi:hypothetical protein